jgi:catechol 2,3-dioxygenase-like lactoylglutathione lyase family enzyme
METRPQKLAHAVFRTDRLEEMTAWRTTVPGARVVFDPEQLLARFRRGDPVSGAVQQGSA